jgi:NTP pyrophosphatase (non-canonical NTP hydrolase)
MDEIDKDQLYRSAWKHWTADVQMDVLIEEMAELTQAILKTRREGVVFSYAIAEETADVLICLEQIERVMRDINLWETVQSVKEKKLERLKDRLMDSLADKYPGLGE